MHARGTSKPWGHRHIAQSDRARRAQGTHPQTAACGRYASCHALDVSCLARKWSAHSECVDFEPPLDVAHCGPYHRLTWPTGQQSICCSSVLL